ncbi:MAG TPA: hypothetical protein DCS15_03565, partial [Flavobacteriales bacterium]|nr:hypothetical protein [Flavobacteriales bacterium]
MKSLFIFFLLYCLTSLNAFSQFQHTKYVDDDLDRNNYSILNIDDGSEHYYVTGTQYDLPNSSGVYVSVKRLNKNGNPVWEKKYTTATVNHGLGSCLSYHSSSDGLKNVVITGTFTNTQGLDRLYVLELNGADGSIVH